MTGNDAKELRKAHGLSQEDFWRRIGITRSDGGRYERRYKLPANVELLLELAYGTNDDAVSLVVELRWGRDDEVRDLLKTLPITSSQWTHIQGTSRVYQ